MTKDNRKPSAIKLRQRAENLLARLAPKALPEELDAQRILHELQVHHIELEMQNESLLEAQIELDAERARYVDLYDLAPIGYLNLDERGQILQANQKALTLLGVTLSAMVGQLITRFIFPEDQDSFYLHRRQLQESNESQSCELRMLRMAYGTGGEAIRFWAHLESSIVKAIDGTATFRVVMEDISGRKLAEEAAHLLHAQLAALTAAIPGVVYQFLITPSGEWKITYLSNGIEDIFEITAAQALLDPSALTTYILPEDRASQHEAVERSKANLSLYDHDHRIRTAGGRLKWISGRAMPHRLSDGTVLWNGILTDITRKRLVDTQLQDLAHQLAQRRHV